MILTLLLPWFALASGGCEFPTPCDRVNDWKSESSLGLIPGKPSPETQEKVIRLILGAREKLQPELSALVQDLSPEAGAQCIANKLFSYLLNPLPFSTFPCPASTQEAVNHYFDFPTEKSQADYFLAKEIIPILRPDVSGEIEKRMAGFVEEIKTELVTYLASQKADKKFITLVKNIIYTPATCIGFKGREKISFEAGKEIYACQGFVWKQNSLFLAIWTLAHEIGHSLDACDLTRAGLLKGSTKTKSLESLLKNHPTKALYEKAWREGTDAKDWNKADSVCDYTNLQEAFADTVAATIAPLVIAKVTRNPELMRLGYLSVGTRICRIKNYPGLDQIPAYSRHPLGDHRLNFLFNQPLVREQMGCR